MKRSGFFIMSKKLFIKGTLLLTFAGLLSRLMGFFYRIFLSHTIGAHGLGIFQLILPLQILIMSICASGIQTAISRLTAAEKVSKNPRETLGIKKRGEKMKQTVLSRLFCSYIAVKAFRQM